MRPESRLGQVLMNVSVVSYGIYLMCPFVQVPIRVFAYKQLKMPYMICMFLMLVFGFWFPYFAVKVIRRNQVLKMMFLGEI